MLEASRRKGLSNAWVVKFLKGHTRAIKILYRVNEIDRVYMLKIYRREGNQSLKAKSNIPRYLKVKMSRNYHNKINKNVEKIGYKIPNNSREVLILDKNNRNTL